MIDHSVDKVPTTLTESIFALKYLTPNKRGGSLKWVKHKLVNRSTEREWKGRQSLWNVKSMRVWLTRELIKQKEPT